MLSVPYSIEKLTELLVGLSGAAERIVEKKLHTSYFKEYFEHLGAKTIVVEGNYIDRDYLDDYAGFYVRCYSGSYKRECSRLHFFSSEFADSQFRGLLAGDNTELAEQDLAASFLGFIVVKHLPKSIIGRTCLRTYEAGNGRRFYAHLRDYKVNLFGIPLEVKSTLAFQEQDSEVAACATTALWTVFQATGEKFQLPTPSPIQITRIATELPEIEVPGVLPNHGLVPRQMLHAIRKVGMEVNVIDPSLPFGLKGFVQAFLHSGIPLILVVSLWDFDEAPGASFRDGPWHAVAVTGCGYGDNLPIAFGDTGFVLRASRIDRLYVHDDQVGPFARMTFNGCDDHTIENVPTLTTSWRGGRNSDRPTVRAKPELLIIPLYAKMRIRFDLIRSIIVDLDAFFKPFLVAASAGVDPGLEWDIILNSVNDFKADIRRSDQLAHDPKLEFLLKPMPRFIWRASAFLQGRRVLDLVFDATQIEQGAVFLQCISYNEDVIAILRQAASDYSLHPPNRPLLCEALLSSL